jgi:UDP-glucose 6-dehydrogenase
MILVVGCGFVGETVAASLEADEKEVVRIDPKYNNNKISDYPNARGAVVAVPTPTVEGKCDDSIIRSVIAEVGDIPILLKSTVPFPMMETYPSNVIYNPEFLRAKTAADDFANQKYFILGGGTNLQRFFWKQTFGYLDVEFIDTDRKTASMVKYMHNAWLATKVAFFHEVFWQIGEHYNHEQMIDILSKFENIGPSHMVAPNDEGKLGYSGHCFPKDTEAFYDFTGSRIMQRVIEVNNSLRKK